MLQAFNDRISDLKDKQRKKANWTRQKEILSNELKRKTHERDQWAEQLREEQKDVDRLKGISLGALFFSLIGKKEEKLSQEEAELLQAKLKYDEAADTVLDLEKELSEIERELAAVRYVESDIELAMREKKEHIYKVHPALAAELESLSGEETEAQADAKELKEAVSAGRSVVSALDQASDLLNSAKNWGTFDMLGGGMIATAAKHNRIDDARAAIHMAQSRLRRFETELKDVERDVHISIDISGMLTFADFFFDGLIMDWVVQGRINDAISQVSGKTQQIRRILSELEGELGKKESLLQDLRRKQAALIEQA